MDRTKVFKNEFTKPIDSKVNSLGTISVARVGIYIDLGDERVNLSYI